MKIISIALAIILTLVNYSTQKNECEKVRQVQTEYIQYSDESYTEPLPTTPSEYTILEINEYGDICIIYNGEPTWVTPLPDPDFEEIVDWNEFDKMLEKLDGEFIPNENDNSELT